LRARSAPRQAPHRSPAAESVRVVDGTRPVKSARKDNLEQMKKYCVPNSGLINGTFILKYILAALINFRLGAE
jgi:hypothetical protein